MININSDFNLLIVHTLGVRGKHIETFAYHSILFIQKSITIKNGELYGPTFYLVLLKGLYEPTFPGLVNFETCVHIKDITYRLPTDY